MTNAAEKWTSTRCHAGQRPNRRRPVLSRASQAPVLLAALSTLWAADVIAGSGFLLRSQSATTLGTAQAGMSTNTEDMTAMVFNPALLGYATRIEADAGLTPIFSNGHFDPNYAATFLGTPILGNSGGEPSLSGYPVNLYVAAPLGNGFTTGFALTSMYGLGFEWESGWIGRYHAIKSELATFDLVPSLGYRTGSWSFGAGVNVRYARAKTTTAIDFGTIAFAATGGAIGTPAGNDGSLSTKLDNWGVGATVGVAYNVGEETRLGVSVRSRLKVNLGGDANFDTGGPVGQAVAALTGQFQNTGGNAPLTFPAAVIAGIDQKLSDRWRLLADVQWTQWSSLSQLELSFANPLQQPITTQLDWRNSWYVAAGLRYEHDDKWTFRAGVAYDQTPTRHETSTPAIPDANSVWVTVGGAYRFDNSTKVDFAYGHIFVQDNPISLLAGAPGNALRGTLVGTITGSSVNFFGVQISHAY